MRSSSSCKLTVDEVDVMSVLLLDGVRFVSRGYIVLG